MLIEQLILNVLVEIIKMTIVAALQWMGRQAITKAYAAFGKKTRGDNLKYSDNLETWS